MNNRIKDYAGETKNVEYVDVNPVLFNTNGTPRLELYVADQLHLHPPAYEGFARILKPMLTKAGE